MLENLLQRNKSWADDIKSKDEQFFMRLSQQQAPEYLWIGCADSRVPANQIVDLLPGELFVHRNVANVVVHTDLNCLSVLQFAVDVLKVKHVMVVGHYGCGGVRAALRDDALGLINNWLRHVQDVRDKYQGQLDALTSEDEKVDRLCELNVIEQVRHVCQTTIVQDAWQRGQELSIHGWVYAISDGLVRNLDICVSSQDQREPHYQRALRRIESGQVQSGPKSSPKIRT
ncbi:carbonate dehydratase [Mangrovitalea sediminis]|uniref:carbonate dehydratase n=1 Tax=Mangrovitalea sediminis TaxID=1982043 RepID=UPI001D0D12C2|nr:carbonate dehydratase [Mangrovitalea sediminis]